MLLLAAALVFVIALLTRPLLISLNGEEEIELCYGDEYVEEGARIKWDLGVAKIKGTVDTTTIGEYEIVYSFLTERVKRTVRVVDKVRPEITLDGSLSQYYETGSEYTEYGYTAWDEIDGDLTEKVEVDISELDMSKEGTYHVNYIVSDAAGNAVRERREVIVVEDGPMTQDIWHFSLHPFFDDIICKEVPFDQEKYDSLWVFGDSFIGNLQYYGGYNWYRTIYLASLSTDDFLTASLRYYDGFDTFDTVMAKAQPKAMLVLLNSDWTGRWSVDYVAKSCDKAYAKLKEKLPDTQIIICSLMPVDKYFTVGGLGRNNDIDKMNVQMCLLCRKYGFKFMNAAEIFRNPNTGGCYDEYISGDHIHLSASGFRRMREYIEEHLDW